MRTDNRVYVPVIVLYWSSNRSRTPQTFTFPTCRFLWTRRSWIACCSPLAKSSPHGSSGTTAATAEAWASPGQWPHGDKRNAMFVASDAALFQTALAALDANTVTTLSPKCNVNIRRSGYITAYSKLGMHQYQYLRQYQYSYQLHIYISANFV